MTPDAFRPYVGDSAWLADSAFTVLPDTLPVSPNEPHQLPPLINGAVVFLVFVVICFAAAWALWTSFVPERDR